MSLHKKFFLLIFFVFLCTTGKSQNSLNTTHLNILSIADDLFSKHQYKQAKEQYITYYNMVDPRSKEFIKANLKLWDTNHKLLIFSNDSIFFNNIIKSKFKTNNEYILAHCLRAKGFFLNNNFEEGKKLLDQIKLISEKSNNVHYYNTLSSYYSFKSNMPEATKAAFNALLEAEKSKNTEMIINMYSKLSRIYLHTSLYDESLKYAKKSIHIQNEKNLITHLGENYEDLMYIYHLDSTKQDSAHHFAEMSLHFANLSGDLITQINQNLNLAFIFSYKKNYEKAKSYLGNIKKIFVDYTIPIQTQIQVELYLGVFEMENENYEKAIEIFLNLKDRYAEQSRSEEHLCYEYLSKCYLLTGRMDKALEMEKMRSSTKEKYESEASRKELLSSELKYELLQKDQIILKDKLTILQKELDSKKWSDLYRNKESENLQLQQDKIISEEKNKNLHNQFVISNQKNEIALKQKQITILRKNKIIYIIIAVSIFLGILTSLYFLYQLWKKSNSLKKLEYLMMTASQNLLKAKKHLEILDENTTLNNATELDYNFNTFVKDFDVFEKEIQEIVDDTQKYKFRIHHEIKAPILKIQNLLSKLNISENISGEEKMTLSLIQNNIKSMKETTEKMLLLSKIQRVALQVSDIDLKEQITDVIDNLPLEHKSILEFSMDTKAHIQADPLLMKILWENMISNSLKYAYKNRAVKISISVHEFPNHFFIYYTDNAQGIHMDEMENLDISRQILKDSKSNKIGLNIIQNIVDKHLGEFRIHETSAEGTTFTFSISRKCT